MSFSRITLFFFGAFLFFCGVFLDKFAPEIHSRIISYSSVWENNFWKNSENVQNSWVWDMHVSWISAFESPKINIVKRTLAENYYHFSEKTQKEIEDGMIKGIVESLGDKHSSYFDPTEAREFTEVLKWDFEGIGAVIDTHMKGIIIRKILDTSPAQKAWLQEGDIITLVWTESVVWLGTDEAVKKIRGPKWSKVILTYLRWDYEKEETTEVTRDVIMIPSVDGKILSWSLGYIEVAYFGDHTEQEFQKTLENLISSWAVGLILDFRNNGGGYLNTAVDILSSLLPSGKVAVITRENDPWKTEFLMTHSDVEVRTNLPIVMLVNNLSASATEIVAGALQDYGRALLIWEKTYGKWSVQEPFILDDGSILKITIGKWYTPKNQNIDKDGIKPDIIIPLYDRDFEKKYDRQWEYAKEILTALITSGGNVSDTISTLRGKDYTK